LTVLLEIECSNVVVDYKVTERSFAFASKRKAPFFFASASDGTNVVQIFETAIKAGFKCKQKPPSDYYEDVMKLLEEVQYR
jgi:Rab-like protein 2